MRCPAQVLGLPEQEPMAISGMLRREAIKEGSFMQKTCASNLLGTHQIPFIHILIIDACRSLEAPTLGVCHRQACLRHTCWGPELKIAAKKELAFQA